MKNTQLPTVLRLILSSVLILSITVGSNYYYYYPSPYPQPAMYNPGSPFPRTTTSIVNSPGAPFGIISSVPYDPADSFTNYDWEPPATENANSEDGVSNWTVDNGAQPKPTIERGSSTGEGTIRIPIRPYETHMVVMDGNEDSFDGISNNRWMTDPTAPPIHEAFLRGRTNPVIPPSSTAGRSNIPLGRRLGFDIISSTYDIPDNRRLNRDRYANVHFSNLIATRSLYNPPHFPGLQ